MTQWMACLLSFRKTAPHNSPGLPSMPLFISMSRVLVSLLPTMGMHKGFSCVGMHMKFCVNQVNLR